MYQRQVTFQEAVDRAIVRNYCNFSGRASRSEYWWYVLFTFVLSFAVSMLAFVSKDVMQVINAIVSIALLLPGLGLCVRRLHDISKSGWWILISLIPIVGWIILIVWYCKDSYPESNQWGPVPNLMQ